MPHPKVTIIILNWNGKEDTIECRESLKHITYPNYEILLVDNGSTDGSVECFRERYPGMEIIETGENLGFAEGNNVGIRRAMDEGADYVLLLNNDTVVDPEFLGELVKVAESDLKIGIVGPKIYYYDYGGRKDVIWFAGGKINWWWGIKYHLGRGIPDFGQFNETSNSDFISGCCFLIKSEIIHKIGLLDDIYFCYSEDADWSIRAKKAAYNVIYVPQSIIWHKISKSAGYGSPLMVYYETRNTILFVKKNYTYSHYIIFLILFVLCRMPIGMLKLICTRPHVLKNYILGIVNGYLLK